MAASKLRELLDEFKTVIGGNTRIADVVLPPILFLAANRLWGLQWAIWSSLAIALVFLVYRLRRGQAWGYALAGLASVVLAASMSYLTDSAAGFFLPDIISGGLMFLLAIGSILVKRPLAALSSHLTRGWAPAWYWHPKVRPAYAEVTWGWAVFFGLRLYLQVQTYLTGSTERLGFMQIISGLPALILILIASYLFGVWRLQNLAGPSVEEFETGAEAPWQGQKRGF